MAADSTAQLQNLIDRLRAGDLAARDELIGRAYERLRRLAHKMLQRFPRVHSFEETGDVLHDSLPRLRRALEAVPPASVAEFFGLASRQMRWELLDLAKRYRRMEGSGGGKVPAAKGHNAENTPSENAARDTYNPLFWTEINEMVEALPQLERQVFELRWYQGMKQEEAAAVLGVAVITIRRHWLEARRRLGQFLRDAQAD